MIFFTVLYCKEKVLETGGSPQEMLEQLWDVLEQVKYIVVFPVKGGPAQWQQVYLIKRLVCARVYNGTNF